MNKDAIKTNPVIFFITCVSFLLCPCVAMPVSYWVFSNTSLLSSLFCIIFLTYPPPPPRSLSLPPLPPSPQYLSVNAYKCIYPHSHMYAVNSVPMETRSPAMLCLSVVVDQQMAGVVSGQRCAGGHHFTPGAAV